MSQRSLGLRITVRLLTTVALCWGLVGASLAVFAQPASAAPGPFTCQPVFYQVDAGQLGVMNPVTGVTTPIGAQNDWYNGIGYNTADNYIYGFGTGQTNMSHLLKIANDGSITDLGIPAGLPAGVPYFIGSFDASGNLIAGSGFGYYSVNVTANTATALPVPVANVGSDIAIVNGVGYSVSGQTLTSIDLSTFAVTSVPVTGLPTALTGYGSAWKDGSNNIYFRDNSSGSIFKVSNYTTATPSATLSITGPPTGNNDGTNCPTSSPFAPPAAVNDAYTTPYQTALNVPAPGVLGNDSGVSITVTANTNPSHGTVTVNADGSLVYTPVAGFSGPDTFTYTITDSFGRTATATVTITVGPPPPPVTTTTTTTTTTAPVVPVVVEGKTVTAAPAVVATGTLPRTGSSSLLFTLVGLTLILVGFGLSVFSGKFRFFKLPELAISEAQRD